MLKKIFTSFLSLVFFSTLMIQCYGSFPMVRTIYNFNASIGDTSKGGGVIRSVVMILMLIIPVYEISFLADAVILNAIEFWGGKKIHLRMKSDSLSIEEKEDTLIISNNQNQFLFYLLRNRPGEVFIYKNNEYIPVQAEIQDSVLLIKDNEKILFRKKLSAEETLYLFGF